MNKLFATLIAAVFAAATVTPVIAQDKKDAPKADAKKADDKKADAKKATARKPTTRKPKRRSNLLFFASEAGPHGPAFFIWNAAAALQ